MPSKRVLITGATGLLGHSLIDTLPRNIGATGASRGAQAHSVHDSLNYVSLDVTDAASVSRLFSNYSFDAVIHAASEGSVDKVEDDPIHGYESIVQGTANVALAAATQGAHLIYVSTNAVFSGNNAPYTETSETNPRNKYGQLKREAERICLKADARWSIVRPILLYGWPAQGQRSNPVASTIAQLSSGHEIRMVNDVWENPMNSHHCAESIWTIVQREVGGITHLAGATRVNRFELAMAAADSFGLNSNLIREVTSDAFPEIAPRPRDTTFVLDKMINQLDVKPLSLSEGLQRMAREHR